VQLPDEVVTDLRKRLKRAGGQVQAVETMLAEGRECRDIVTQLSAATKALEQVGFRLIASGLTYCLEHPKRQPSPAIPSMRSSVYSPSWREHGEAKLRSLHSSDGEWSRTSRELRERVTDELRLGVRRHHASRRPA